MVAQLRSSTPMRQAREAELDRQIELLVKESAANPNNSTFSERIYYLMQKRAKAFKPVSGNAKLDKLVMRNRKKGRVRHFIAKKVVNG